MDNLKSSIHPVVDKANKRVIIKCEGYLSAADPIAFQKEYANAVAASKGEDLFIDMTDMLPFAQQDIQAVGDMFKVYATDFGKVYAVNPTNVIAKSQIKRIVKNNDLTTLYTFIDHM